MDADRLGPEMLIEFRTTPSGPWLPGMFVRYLDTGQMLVMDGDGDEQIVDHVRRWVEPRDK